MTNNPFEFDEQGVNELYNLVMYRLDDKIVWDSFTPEDLSPLLSIFRRYVDATRNSLNYLKELDSATINKAKFDYSVDCLERMANRSEKEREEASLLVRAFPQKNLEEIAFNLEVELGLASERVDPSDIADGVINIGEYTYGQQIRKLAQYAWNIKNPSPEAR